MLHYMHRDTARSIVKSHGLRVLMLLQQALGCQEVHPRCCCPPRSFCWGAVPVLSAAAYAAPPSTSACSPPASGSDQTRWSGHHCWHRTCSRPGQHSCQSTEGYRHAAQIMPKATDTPVLPAAAPACQVAACSRRIQPTPPGSLPSLATLPCQPHSTPTDLSPATASRYCKPC